MTDTDEPDESEQSEYVKIGPIYWERESLVIEHDPVRTDSELTQAVILADDYDPDRGMTPWEAANQACLGDPPEEFGWYRSVNSVENDVDIEEYLRLRNVEVD